MIHKYRFDELNIVVDSDSCAIHVVDDVAYRVLDLYKSYPDKKVVEILQQEFPDSEVRSSLKELHNLENQGQLFYEMELPENHHEPVLKALCLHVAHDCNLRCGYCFASTGDFKGNRQLMSENVGKQALNFILHTSGNRKYIEIDFFGGEPMLNFPVIRNLVYYGKEQAAKLGKIIRFTMTTNATIMNDEALDFLNSEDISLVLSIDGRQEVNDRMRKTINGKGSYSTIIKNIENIIGSREGQNYYLRGTYTHYNTDFSKDIIHLADLGYKNISIEPVVANGCKDYAFVPEDIAQIFEEYKILTREIINRRKRGEDLNFFHFNIDPENGPCAYKRSSGCGAGIEYCAVTPTGEIYPCHQFVSDVNFVIGDVFKGIKNNDVVKLFGEASLLNKTECVNCWAKYFCGGGCYANAYNFNQNLKQPYSLGCEMECKRLECAIYLYIKNKLQ